MSPEFVLWNIPAEPEIPNELHGQKVVMVAGVYAGPSADAEAVLAPLAELGTILLDARATVDYVQMQAELDPAFPAGDRYYFKSLYFREPGRILFEIATDGPGFATDEDPEHLGEGLALPPFLEPHRAAIEAGLKPLT